MNDVKDPIFAFYEGVVSVNSKGNPCCNIEEEDGVYWLGEPFDEFDGKKVKVTIVIQEMD